MLGRLVKIAAVLTATRAGRDGADHSRRHQADGARGIRDQFRHRQSRRQV